MRRIVGFTLMASALIAGLAQAQTPERVRIGVNGGAQLSTSTASQDFTFPLYLENARLQNDIDLTGGSFFDIGGAYRVTRTLWAGVSFSSLTRTVDGAMTATLPHPFYFESPRIVDATVKELEGTEQGVHLSLLYPIAISNKLEVAIFGGPSYFKVTQDLVTGLNLDDTYPFEDVTIDSAPSVNASASAWGGHVGADISWRLSPMFRVGALLRFAKGATTLDTGNGDEVALSPGGFVAGGGVRVVF